MPMPVPALARSATALPLVLLLFALLPGPPLGPVVEVARPRWLWPALSSGLGQRPPRLPGHGQADDLEPDAPWDEPEGEPEGDIDRGDRGIIASPLDEEWP